MKSSPGYSTRNNAYLFAALAALAALAAVLALSLGAEHVTPAEIIAALVRGDDGSALLALQRVGDKELKVVLLVRHGVRALLLGIYGSLYEVQKVFLKLVAGGGEKRISNEGGSPSFSSKIYRKCEPRLCAIPHIRISLRLKTGRRSRKPEKPGIYRLNSYWTRLL